MVRSVATLFESSRVSVSMMPIHPSYVLSGRMYRASWSHHSTTWRNGTMWRSLTQSSQMSILVDGGKIQWVNLVVAFYCIDRTILEIVGACCVRIDFVLRRIVEVVQVPVFGLVRVTAINCFHWWWLPVILPQAVNQMNKRTMEEVNASWVCTYMYIYEKMCVTEENLNNVQNLLCWF